jgi:hypothetical protein
MRLFRQAKAGDWAEVVGQVRRALEDAVQSGVERVTRATTGQALAVSLSEASTNHLCIGGVVETRHGIVQYFPGQSDISVSIEYYGEHSQLELEVLARLVEPSMIVLEIDAGIGAHSLWLAHKVGNDGHLFLYENEYMRRQALAQNLRANNVTNATLMQRRMRCSTRAQETHGASSLAAAESEDSIDDLRLGRLHFVKVNDPSNALPVLEGAAETVWQYRPLLQFNVASDEAFRDLTSRVGEFGYACWRCEKSLFNPDNFNRRTDNRFGGRRALALIGVPEESDMELSPFGCQRVA